MLQNDIGEFRHKNNNPAKIIHPIVNRPLVLFCDLSLSCDLYMFLGPFCPLWYLVAPGVS